MARSHAAPVNVPRFVSPADRMMRATAYILITSAPVAPGRMPSTSFLLYIGASDAMKLSGTNSVKPPVSFWMSRSSPMCAATWRGVSMWPYMIVDVVGMPIRCAVVTTSTHWSFVMRPAEIHPEVVEKLKAIVMAFGG